MYILTYMQTILLRTHIITNDGIISDRRRNFVRFQSYSQENNGKSLHYNRRLPRRSARHTTAEANANFSAKRLPCSNNDSALPVES